MNRQSKEPLPTQEFIICTHQVAHQVTQREFNKNPWLYALDFVRSQGRLPKTFIVFDTPKHSIDCWIRIIVGLVNINDSSHGTLLGSINYTFDHVPLTVIIVKSCTPIVLATSKLRSR